MSVAIEPPKWVSDENGTFDPAAICPHCGSGHGQVLGGAKYTVRCRCTNATCERTFLHLLWVQ